MKNIHILPTDNYKNVKLSLFNDKLYLGDVASIAKPQNIHITSDEEIKKGDWVIWFGRDNLPFLKKVIGERDGEWLISSTYDMWVEKNKVKKIILTTDPDLIKDGVQAIPDEFLQWFVKNPTCEWVEVRKDCCGQCDERLCEVYDRGGEWTKENTVYEIIIPKEELKEDLVFPEGYYDFKIIKGENIEEAAKRFWGESTANPIEMAIFGAKWQAEQDKNLYSEKETIKISKLAVKEFLETNNFSITYDYQKEVFKEFLLNYDEWFEQFKKK